VKAEVVRYVIHQGIFGKIGSRYCRIPSPFWAIILLVLFQVSLGRRSVADEKADNLALIDAQSEAASEAEYKHLYESQLFLTPGDLARFVQLPGPLADSEVAVSLHKTTKRGHASKYELTLTRSKIRLADAVSTNPKRRDDMLKASPAQRIDAPCPESMAMAINRLWLIMLKQAQPDPCAECIAEGPSQIFSATAENGRLLRAMTPIKPLHDTIELTDLGRALVEYCDALPALRSALARRVEEQARRLASRRNSAAIEQNPASSQ
jgi:hypothetical protein